MTDETEGRESEVLLTGDRCDTLAAALAAFQADLPTIGKQSKADTGAYAYSYAPLEDITAKVLPALAAQGLAYTCRLMYSAIPGLPPLALRCTLLHVSGESESGEWPVQLASPQQMGSAITYGRRYMLLALCGVAPGGEDDDGRAAEDAHPKAGKSHAALVKDTLATPKRATRSKTAKGDDEWTDPPPMQILNVTPAPPARDPDVRTNDQSTAIFALLGEIGLAHDRDQSIALLSALVGRKLASSKELTRGDAQHVINSLQELRDSPDAGGAIRTLIDAGML